MVDPTGFIITTIRTDPAVAALTTRVRGGKPMPPTGMDPGDARGPGKYVRFVVVVRLGARRLRRAPVAETRLAARCYGTDEQDAALLAGTVSDSVHAKGPMVSPTGVGIYLSFDDGAEDSAAKDPITDQPYETVIISVQAATQLIA